MEKVGMKLKIVGILWQDSLPPKAGLLTTYLQKPLDFFSELRQNALKNMTGREKKSSEAKRDGQKPFNRQSAKEESYMRRTVILGAMISGGSVLRGGGARIGAQEILQNGRGARA